MRYLITHHGVPIGTVDLDLRGGRTDGPVSVLPAYQTIKALVQRVTKALHDVRSRTRGARTDRRERFREAAELTRELELRDEQGQPVVTDYLVLNDEGSEPPMLTAIGMRDLSES